MSRRAGGLKTCGRQCEQDRLAHEAGEARRPLADDEGSGAEQNRPAEMAALEQLSNY
jgi:hypothetical protein